MGCLCGKETVDVEDRTFTVVKCLAEGGFSLVYLVNDRRSGKAYAMKKIVCHSNRDRRRAEAEIQIHKRINSRYVIPLEASNLDAIKQDSSLVCSNDDELPVAVDVILILPFYKKGTLQDELFWRNVAGKHIEEQRVLRIFRGICEAVKAFHDLKPEPYAHRDLKPGNVLLSDNDSPIIMDLGSADIARIKISSSREARALQDCAAEHSTMPYRAPELFNVESGAEIDERTDIWSLGCLLYAMCFFFSPFDKVEERGGSIALAVLTGTIEVQKDSPYSSECHELIRFMLQVEPRKRPFIEDVLDRTTSLLRTDSTENNISVAANNTTCV